MRKLAIIAWNEARLQVRDPILWLLAIPAPLLVAVLIYLAFGNLALGQTMPEAAIAVGIVNQDRGGARGELGQIFLRILAPQPDDPPLPVNVPATLFAPRLLADEAQARRLIERGELAAALVIPPDFSQALADERATVRVLVSGREPALGQAFAATVRGVAATISLGEVTIRAAVNGLLTHGKARALLTSGALDDPLADLAFAAVSPAANPIQIERLGAVNRPVQIRLTHYLAATIAITMLGLTTLLTNGGIFQERVQHTLQRAWMTPTPPWFILAGKAMGAFLTGLLQVTALIGGLALLETLQGTGSATAFRLDPLGVGLLVCATVVAATGYGVVIAGLTRTFTEAVLLGAALLMLMGLIGGVFFPADLLPPAVQAAARGTYHFWAMDGYLRLARGAGVGAIWPHLAVLATFGLSTAALGFHLLRRRVEVV